jgi:hypothetical protein
MLANGGWLSAADQTDAGANPIPVLTVCQALSAPAKYGGQIVIIVGRLRGTDEGGWLTEDCGLKNEIEGRTYGNAISITYLLDWVAEPPSRPAGFKWDRGQLYQALGEVRKTTSLEGADQWYAFFGRLETTIPLKKDLGYGRTLMRYGYGHLNSAPAELVWPAVGGALRLKER